MAGVTPEKYIPWTNLLFLGLMPPIKTPKLPQNQKKKIPEILTLVSRIKLKCSEQCE